MDGMRQECLDHVTTAGSPSGEGKAMQWALSSGCLLLLHHVVTLWGGSRPAEFSKNLQA